MMSKLAVQHDEQNKQFKPKIYQSKRRGQMRNFYDRKYQKRYRSGSRDNFFQWQNTMWTRLHR